MPRTVTSSDASSASIGRRGRPAVVVTALLTSLLLLVAMPFDPAKPVDLVGKVCHDPAPDESSAEDLDGVKDSSKAKQIRPRRVREVSRLRSRLARAAHPGTRAVRPAPALPPPVASPLIC